MDAIDVDPDRWTDAAELSGAQLAASIRSGPVEDEFGQDRPGFSDEVPDALYRSSSMTLSLLPKPMWSGAMQR